MEVLTYFVQFISDIRTPDKRQSKITRNPFQGVSSINIIQKIFQFSKKGHEKTNPTGEKRDFYFDYPLHYILLVFFLPKFKQGFESIGTLDCFFGLSHQNYV